MILKTKRNQKIFAMRKEGVTLDEISKKFKLSAERIRQILEEPNFCIFHSKKFLNECPYCFIENEYRLQLLKLDKTEYLKIGESLGQLGRTGLEVSKRRVWIKIGKDVYKYPFAMLARILKRDHTTVLNSYYNG